MVQEHQEENLSLWAAVESLAPKIGCVPHTLYEGTRKHEVDSDVRQGTTTADKDRLWELERENRKLRKANEILKLASAFFIQAQLDRRLKNCYDFEPAPRHLRGRACLQGTADGPVIPPKKHCLEK